MTVCLATYQSAILLKGGPRTQIFQTKQGLEKLGVNVQLFESWQDYQKDEIDLFHLFGANIGTYHLAREIHKLGIPMVVSPIFFTRHSASFVRFITGADRLVRSIARGTWSDYGIASEICSWAKTVLPNTQQEARLIEKGLGIAKEKIFVVPNGVEERFAHAEPSLFKKEFGMENFILNVGHIGPERKNVLMLIQALEQINHPAVIIGRIENNEYGQRCLAEARKNPRLKILDSIDHDSELLASAYTACDVFALPSQYETPGIAALEAALSGAKVVITKYGGTEDYFAGLAEYVEPTSVESIRNGIVTALNKKKDSVLQDHVKKEFLWQKVAEKTKHVYEKLSNVR